MKNTVTKKDKNEIDLKTNNFANSLLGGSILTSGDPLSPNFDIGKAKQENLDAFEALGIEGGLQMMLASQMLAIHNLQKEMIIQSNITRFPDQSRYYANTAIKLANTFTQQATLLSKLQGGSNQKMTVEHVHVHDGGQAIVGCVHNTGGGSEKK